MASVAERDPHEDAAEAGAAIDRLLGGDHEVAVVLGSGWQHCADVLGPVVAEVEFAAIPHFAVPEVAGHGGTLRSVEVEGRRVLVLLGRVHAYEGHAAHRVVHPVRSAIAAGCRTIVLTNAAGGIDPDLVVGAPVLVSDHLNLTGSSPLVGPHLPSSSGPRFPDMTAVYPEGLRAVALEIDPSLRQGVYAGVLGPQYETPAEIRMLRTLGADLVGMSTVLEAIAATHLGADVLGLSLVTNLAAGMGGRLDHDEVLEVAARSGPGLGRLLAEVIPGL